MPALHFHPFPVLTTEHLCLRQLRHDDAPAFYALRTNPQVNLFLDRTPPSSPQEVEELIGRLNAGIDRNEWLFWAISQEDGGLLIGTICLWHIDPAMATAELGFELHPAFQKKGLMQEAVHAVLRHGFSSLQLERIEGWTHQNNLPSIRLMEKINFQRDPVAEAKNAEDPETAQMVVYTLAHDEYSI